MSDETKHTPGPWEVIKENRGAIPHQWRPLSIVANADGPDEKIIARLPDGLGPEDFANAALIASAPRLKAERDELLAALEALVNDVYFLLRPENPPCQKLSIDRRERWASVIEAKKIIAKCGR